MAEMEATLAGGVDAGDEASELGLDLAPPVFTDELRRDVLELVVEQLGDQLGDRDGALGPGEERARPEGMEHGQRPEATPPLPIGLVQLLQRREQLLSGLLLDLPTPQDDRGDVAPPHGGRAELDVQERRELEEVAELVEVHGQWISYTDSLALLAQTWSTMGYGARAPAHLAPPGEVPSGARRRGCPQAAAAVA